ncbi:NUDIX hydrolase [uncultured Secundilactobacillus sp.]|uniref:NUDIX hydrolase n=1 Tax=uncultured Secundilactobacillus sp. TaxID=2813935 RepID=UPI002584ABEF|nr:NUDIX domain-containing protein [uncultured Secundilactobacillus sp.]
MSYILDLRAKVGSQPLISVGAAVIIFNETGQFLLVHRTDTRTWGLPAGSKEPNEALETTAQREVWEETGLHLSNLTARFTLSGPNCQFTYPNGDQIDAVIAVYDTQVTQVTQQQPLTPQPGETSEARFFAPSSLPELTPLTRRVLARAALL